MKTAAVRPASPRRGAIRYSVSRSQTSISPLHAQPLSWWQVSELEMQPSPHAFPDVQVLQHVPVSLRHASQLVVVRTNNTVVNTHRLIRIAPRYAQRRSALSAQNSPHAQLRKNHQTVVQRCTSGHRTIRNDAFRMEAR